MTRSPKYISAPELCTGCALCANICPKEAISMEWSSDGFSIPRVNVNLCINCGLCTKFCIAKQPHHKKKSRIHTVNSYAAWSTDATTHASSSSGGVFSALAIDTLQNGGVVFGVVWKDSTTAVFNKATCLAELEPMRSSKYTQALPGQAYREAKNILLTGRQVLFAGTPCQIHALKQYLNHDFENLLTIDIVCHGVPSHHLLEKYVAEAEKKSGKNVSKINFRDKSLDWNIYHVTRHYTDGSVESTEKSQDDYMQLFLSDQVLNKSCYSCAFADIPRQGDITLGDYWGVSPQKHPDWPVHRGISAVLANTDKGHNTLMQIKAKNALVLHTVDFMSIYRWQKRSYISSSVKRDHKRSKLLAMLRSDMPLSTCVDRYAHYFCKGFICINKKGIFFRTLKSLKNRLKSYLHK